MLQVNFALVIYTETDAVVLPPDTQTEMGATIPFYIDPPDQPGAHRDLFRAHGKMMVGELLKAGFALTPALTSRAPQECQDELAAQAEAAESAEAQAMDLYIVEEMS